MRISQELCVCFGATPCSFLHTLLFFLFKAEQTLCFKAFLFIFFTSLNNQFEMAIDDWELLDASIAALDSLNLNINQDNVEELEEVHGQMLPVRDDQVSP